MPYRVPLYKLLALTSGKSVAVGYYDYGDGNTDFYLTRFGANTQVDYSFGSNGLIVTDYSGTIDTLDTAIPSTPNTFIAGGTSSVHSSFRKYDLNGNVIDSFGTNGTLLVRLGFYSSVTDIVKVADGFIAVCRATHINGRYDYSQNLVGLIKFSNDGVLHNSFGQHGAKLTTTGELDYSNQENGKLIAPGIGYPFSSDIVLGDFDLFIEKISDQHFFVIGTVWEDPAWWGGGPHKIFLKKFNISDGTETDTFSAFENNLLTLDSSLSTDIATTLVDTRGKLLIVGTIIADGGCFGIEAFDDMGNIDPTFGINGVAKVNFAAGGTEVGAYAHTATIDNKSGAIYVAGHNGLNGVHNLAVTKLTHEGIVDQSFGIDGKVTVSPFQEYTEFHVTDIQLVKNGDVLILFTSIDTSTLIRLDKHGNLLSGFVKGNDGSNEYFAPSSDDILYGMEGDDVLHGNLGNDHVDGGEGDDELVAGDGDDTVEAGLGDDLIIGGDGKGNDKYYGGEGSDTVRYTSATWGITVDLSKGTAASSTKTVNRRNVVDAASIGSDKLYEIENVTAGNFNDVLSGNQLANEIRGENGNDRVDGKAGNDVLYGGAGNDSLTGGAGNDVMAGGVGDDTYDVDSLADVVTEQADEGIDTVRTRLSSYTLASEVENLTYIGPNNSTLVGNSLDNQIVGGGLADTLDGGTGNDLLLGGLGTDTLVAGWDELALRGGDDTLRGGAGNDTYKIHKSTALYDDIIIDELADRGAGTDTLEIYEDLTLGPDIGTVTRGAILNDDGSITTQFYIDGTAAGSYTIRGQIEYIVNSGKDLDGEWTPLKIQTWYAGKSWKLDQSAAMTLGYGTARNDNLVSSSTADVVSGFSGNDTLTGGLGNDTLDGGGGSDTASYAERTLAVIANLAEGTATIDAETDTLISIENMIGGRGNDELTGNNQANIVDGGRGDDVLDGGGGNDTLIGGAGNDRYRIHEVVGGNDTIQDSGGSDGLDWIDYGQDYVMDMARVGPQGRDLAITFRDISTGDLLQTTTIKAQFSTSPKLGASAIEMFYGMEYDDGNLVYGGPTLKFVGGLVGDTDHNIIVGLAKADIINGGGGMDVIFAGAGNDTVYGGTEDDIISGASGDDRLFGDAGNDELRGDAGNDELTGGSGSDEFWFRFALDSSTNLDTITDFESGADKICLSSQLFHELNGQIDENNFLVNQTGQAEDADDQLIFDTDTRTLYYDADGFGGEASIAFVTLTGVQSLSVGDIMLIG